MTTFTDNAASFGHVTSRMMRREAVGVDAIDYVECPQSSLHEQIVRHTGSRVPAEDRAMLALCHLARDC